MQTMHPCEGTSPRTSNRRSGFTLIEVMVAVVILGVLVGLGMPTLSSWVGNQNARAAVRDVSDAFMRARAQAIASRRVHIVFLSSGAGVDPAPMGQDAGGNDLRDRAGNNVPILVLDDGQLGDPGQDCVVGAAEPIEPVPPRINVNWGSTLATAADVAPLDSAAAVPARGITFSAPNGAQTTWVAFLPTGVPVGFDAGCNMGQAGSGGGSIYVTSGLRDYAVVLTPLGTVRTFSWDTQNGAWTQ